jgi:cytochrome c biogenesis protein CcmG, thiol:disulfide interchange protein DsbE
MRRWLPLMGGIILGLGLGLVLFGLLKSDAVPHDEAAEIAEPLPVPSLDAPAPDFELSALSGERIQLEDYRGQVVLLNFWATWCGPCRLEMPTFQSRAEQFADQLAVVAINNAEAPADVQAFVDELGLSFDILLDPTADIQRMFLVRGYPTTFFVDAEGVVRVQHVGIMTEDQLDGYLRELGVE